MEMRKKRRMLVCGLPSYFPVTEWKGTKIVNAKAVVIQPDGTELYRRSDYSDRKRR